MNDTQPQCSEQHIQSLRDQLQKSKITNRVLLTLCEEAQTLVLKSPNEALIRRWFADLRAAQKEIEGR